MIAKIKVFWKSFQLWVAERPLFGGGRLYVLSSGLGLGVGLLAVLLTFSIDHFREMMIHQWAGLSLAVPGPGGGDGSVADFRPWVLLFIPALGGLCMGFLSCKFSPDCFGGGTDRIIRAFHHGRGEMPGRVAFWKILTTSFIVGSGGSAGKEGPAQQVGAAAGSALARWMKLEDSEKRILLTAGAAAGMGAVFKAPLGGALFACEVYYTQPEFETQAIIPSVMASILSFSVYSLFFTSAPLWQMRDYPVFSFPDLPPLTLLAVIAGIFSIGFVHILRWVEHRTSQIPVLYRPALGGLGLGLLALCGYFALGREPKALGILSESYGTVQQAIDGKVTVELLFLLAAAKLLGTALTLGTGGSGGVFAPSMVMGGLLGGGIGLAAHLAFPHSIQAPAAYIVLGMGGFFAGISKAPISTIIMMTEVAQSYNVLLPLMWVCAIAYLISHRESLFTGQLRRQAESPAHRGEFVVDILRDLHVSDLLGKGSDRIVLTPDASLPSLLQKLKETRGSVFPVVEVDSKKVVGLLERRHLQESVDLETLSDLVVVQELMRTSFKAVGRWQDLDQALTTLINEDSEELPVVDEEGRFQGMITRDQIVQAYTSQTLELRLGKP